ncbi:MAG TPA: hypothetical protein VGI28_04500 [Stellaceae bacterium]
MRGIGEGWRRLGRTIKSAAGMILVIALFLAVAVAGGVMIAVPVPILLHFLSKYAAVTGTTAMVICRLAGVAVLVLALWAASARWREYRACRND